MTTPTPGSFAAGPGWEIHSELDAIDYLKGFPDDTVDLLLFDPPYESLEKHRRVGTTTRLTHSKSSSNDWFAIFENARFPDLFRECYRVLKRNSHLYVFSDQETMFVAKPMGEAARFKWWKGVVWKKGNRIGMGYHYRALHEMVLFFEKGKRRLNNLGVPDVLDISPVSRSKTTYPTEKPVDLLKVFISQSTSPGDLVVDPFMGSGSCGEAALVLGRRFAGNDLSSKSALVTKERLERLQEGGVLHL